MIPQIPEAASGAIAWFDYPVRVQPHHTDYAGVVWHGSYVTWLEEARVECLRAVGIDFHDLVEVGCDLPVIELNLRYHRAARLGDVLVTQVRLAATKGVRLLWDCQIRNPATDSLHSTAQVTLVPMDRQSGRILRQVPPLMAIALDRLRQAHGTP